MMRYSDIVKIDKEEVALNARLMYYAIYLKEVLTGKIPEISLPFISKQDLEYLRENLYMADSPGSLLKVLDDVDFDESQLTKLATVIENYGIVTTSISSNQNTAYLQSFQFGNPKGADLEAIKKEYEGACRFLPIFKPLVKQYLDIVASQKAELKRLGMMDEYKPWIDETTWVQIFHEAPLYVTLNLTDEQLLLALTNYIKRKQELLSNIQNTKQSVQSSALEMVKTELHSRLQELEKRVNIDNNKTKCAAFCEALKERSYFNNLKSQSSTNNATVRSFALQRYGLDITVQVKTGKKQEREAAKQNLLHHFK